MGEEMTDREWLDRLNKRVDDLQRFRKLAQGQEERDLAKITELQAALDASRLEIVRLREAVLAAHDMLGGALMLKTSRFMTWDWQALYEQLGAALEQPAE